MDIRRYSRTQPFKAGKWKPVFLLTETKFSSTKGVSMWDRMVTMTSLKSRPEITPLLLLSLSAKACLACSNCSSCSEKRNSIKMVGTYPKHTFCKERKDRRPSPARPSQPSFSTVLEACWQKQYLVFLGERKWNGAGRNQSVVGEGGRLLGFTWKVFISGNKAHSGFSAFSQLL